MPDPAQPITTHTITMEDGRAFIPTPPTEASIFDGALVIKRPTVNGWVIVAAFAPGHWRSLVAQTVTPPAAPVVAGATVTRTQGEPGI